MQKELEFDQITYGKDGILVENKNKIKTLRINEGDFQKRLTEINETYQIIRDSHTGRAFEIAIVNKHRLMDGAILMPSTSFSSLTQNRGNAIELAAHGAATSDAARVYVAFPGMGGSSSLSRQDRQYLAEKGRFTQNGKALDSISALVSALDSNNISIKSISANAEGGRLALGIMAALPSDSVNSVYLNGLPGIYSLSNDTWISVTIIGQFKIRIKRRTKESDQEDSQEMYKVSALRLEEAKSSLPNIYRGLRYLTRLSRTYLRAMPNMAAYTEAFNRHDDLQSVSEHAVLQDALAALSSQKKARVTFQFNKRGRLHDNLDKCKKFGQTLTEELSKTPFQGSVQFFVYDGSLDFHTSYPSRRWAIEKDALML